jgi:hypothetical protein
MSVTVTTMATGETLLQIVIPAISKQTYLDILAEAPKEIAKLYIQEHKQDIMNALNLNDIAVQIAGALGASIAKTMQESHTTNEGRGE